MSAPANIGSSRIGILWKFKKARVEQREARSESRDSWKLSSPATRYIFPSCIKTSEMSERSFSQRKLIYTVGVREISYSANLDGLILRVEWHILIGEISACAYQFEIFSIRIISIPPPLRIHVPKFD